MLEYGVEANSDMEALKKLGILFHLFISLKLCKMKVVPKPHSASHVGKCIDVPLGTLNGEFGILQIW